MATIKSDQAVLEFRALFQKELEKLADRLAREMVDAMNASTDANNWFREDVKRYVTSKVTPNGSKWSAVVGLVGDKIPERVYYKAFIMAYGSGIHINKGDNLWFNDFYTGDYQGSPYWNPNRFPSGAITYRPLGEKYYDFYNDTFRTGHGPNKNGEYHALQLKSFKGIPWFNNAIEKMGLNNKKYIDDKIMDIVKDCASTILKKYGVKGAVL